MVSPDEPYLYFTRAAAATALWRVPSTSAGEKLAEGEQQVCESLFHASNVVVRGGRVYFVRLERQDANPVYHLSLCDPREGHTRDLWTFPKPASFGLSLSPDGRKLLFAQLDETRGDLMLAEDVR